MISSALSGHRLGKSVTHVAGLKCYLCLRSLRGSLFSGILDLARREVGEVSTLVCWRHHRKMGEGAAGRSTLGRARPWVSGGRRALKQR